jgi:hypothetical protein
MGAGTSISSASDVAVLELPAPLVVELKREARRSHKTLDRLIAGFLEDVADARDAEAAYRKHLKSGRKAVPAGKVYADLGLAT